MSDWLFAEFSSSEAMLQAARALRQGGVTGIDAYSPYPLRGAEDALQLPPSKVPLIALAGGLFGASSGYLLQWFTNAVDFPINVGGRPLHAAPSFVPITFELGVLLSALSIFFGLLAMMRFPRPHHPGFEVEKFRSASTHGFWLSVEIAAGDPSRARLAEDLRGLGATHVSVVPEAR